MQKPEDVHGTAHPRHEPQGKAASSGAENKATEAKRRPSPARDAQTRLDGPNLPPAEGLLFYVLCQRNTTVQP